MAIGEKLTTWAKRTADAFRGAIGKLHEADADLRREHTEAVKQRQRIISLPGPIEEVRANLRTLIDALARKWAEDHGKSLIRHASPGFELRPDGRLVPQSPKLPDSFSGEPVNVRMLCALLPDVVLARLDAIATATEYEAGPSVADRKTQLDAIDARIADLEAQHSELVDTAAAMDPPVMLTLLPAVRERRTREAEAAKRDADALARREEAERAANAKAAPGPRVARSSYLQRVNAPID